MDKTKVKQWIFYAIIALILISITTVVLNQEYKKGIAAARQQERVHYEDSLNKAYGAIIAKSKNDSESSARQISILMDSAMSLTKQINNTQNEIYNTQVQTITKVKYANSLSTDSLAVFFTNVVNGYQQ